MRVFVVEGEAYMAGTIRDGLRLEAIAADNAGDGDTALLTAADRLDDKASGFELGYRIDQDQTPDAGVGIVPFVRCS